MTKWIISLTHKSEPSECISDKVIVISQGLTTVTSQNTAEALTISKNDHTLNNLKTQALRQDYPEDHKDQELQTLCIE